MKLSTIITEFRNESKMSQREFARRCDLSNSYISFLEKEMNPKTGKPIVPTIEQYKKLADGMGMTLQQLWEMMDQESPTKLGTFTFDDLTEDEKSFIIAYRAADERARSDALATLLQHPSSLL